MVGSAAVDLQGSADSFLLGAWHLQRVDSVEPNHKHHGGLLWMELGHCMVGVHDQASAQEEIEVASVLMSERGTALDLTVTVEERKMKKDHMKHRLIDGTRTKRRSEAAAWDRAGQH
jgi:hypothetical protein